MGFTVVAVVAGILLGLVSGGRLGNVRDRPFRGIAVLTAAVVLQLAVQLLDLGGTSGLVLLLASYVGLLAVAAANRKLVGMPVVAVGLLCNFVVIAVNGGMPVRAEAITTIDDDVDVATLEFSAKRHLETDDDRLTFLGDVVPVPPLRQVLSFGDLILTLGTADVAFRLVRPLRGGSRRRLPQPA
jgi:hypothetical protein